ncbi:hypothetical protein ACYSNW_02310 [Enterococcus sp. LJL99]
MNIFLLLILLAVFILLFLLQKEISTKETKNQKLILNLTIILAGFAIGMLGFILFGH